MRPRPRTILRTRRFLRGTACTSRGPKCAKRPIWCTVGLRRFWFIPRGWVYGSCRAVPILCARHGEERAKTNEEFLDQVHSMLIGPPKEKMGSPLASLVFEAMFRGKGATASRFLLSAGCSLPTQRRCVSDKFGGDDFLGTVVHLSCSGAGAAPDPD